MRVGFTSGIFDLFHVGHLNVLRRARLNCDRLVVGVTTDEVAVELTGRAPATPFAERLAIVRSMRCVDMAVGRMTADVADLWDQMRFDVLFKGGDWSGSPKGAELERRLAHLPVQVEYFPYTRNTSSERLREALGEQEPELLDDAHAGTTGHAPHPTSAPSP